MYMHTKSNTETEQQGHLPSAVSFHPCSNFTNMHMFPSHANVVDFCMPQMLTWLASSNLGRKETNYKLRDWLFARQRYWGEPFPLIYPEGSDEAVAVPYDQLPLQLPDTDNFKPSGTTESPLAVITEWVNTIDPRTGGPARRWGSGVRSDWTGNQAERVALLCCML